MTAMKQCPECSAQYDDNVSFCTKEGRALTVVSDGPMRLCPHCANSIQASVSRCPYCKAELIAGSVPQWPSRDEPAHNTTGRATSTSRLSLGSKAILICGFVVFALGVFFLGSHQERSETRQLQQSQLKELQTREQRINALEGQIKQAKQEASENAKQITALTAKLNEAQKELASTQQRLASASRSGERTTAVRAANGRSPRRSADPPPATQPSNRAARKIAEPGVYEVIQVTSVRENPSASARAIAQINRGTKVTVVRSVGEWLQVQSKQGNPPGYIRSDDAMFIGQTN